MISIKKRDLLNYLVITIMLVMIGFISLFIFSNIHLKNGMVFRIVQQMDMISNLLSHAVSDILNDKHTLDSYGKALEYGNILGVKDIGVFKENGEEAFDYLNLDWKKYVKVDKKFIRPLEVNLLKGDASLANKELGWRPKVNFRQLVRMMVDADLK